MAGLLKNKANLILVAVVVAAILIGIAYFFADKRSEPIYVSKIDRIMFDHKNKSPKIVLTLPDQVRKETAPKEESSIPNEDIKIAEEETEQDSTLRAIAMMEKMPLFNKLTAISNPKPLMPLDVHQSMVEEVDGLVLPKISASGKKPWIEYNKEENIHPNFYKVSILIKGIGLDENAANAAIETMPANISLSFSPYGRDLTTLMRKARSYGHETYLDLLLCSKNFLKADSGPLAMSITEPVESNIGRIKKSLNTTRSPFGGMIINSGIADEDTKEQLTKFLEYIGSIGLLAIDATGEYGIEAVKTNNVPRRKADIVIEDNFSRLAVDEKLQEAERIAQERGDVLIVVEAKPVVLHAINDWINTFSPQLDYEQMKGLEIEKPLALVPISNLVVE